MLRGWGAARAVPGQSPSGRRVRDIGPGRGNPIQAPVSGHAINANL